MYTNNFFKPVLVEPITAGYNKLKIISGYATAAMAFHHLREIEKINRVAQIELVVGMCPQDGLLLSDHKGFCEIMASPGNNYFSCRYIFKQPPVHSKVYIWTKPDGTGIAYLGSANYTQRAFILGTQRETLAQTDVNECVAYYNMLSTEGILCTHSSVRDKITLFNRPQRRLVSGNAIIQNQSNEEAVTQGLEIAALPLLTRSGDIHQISGLNWGQRDRRDPNQAYIPIPATVYKSTFFPPRKIRFSVLTDDGKIFVCTRAQDNGKAIETPENNSLLGEYFRYRLGVPSGEFVKKSDLLRYGRTDVTFYKLDDENYYLDFSVTS